MNLRNVLRAYSLLRQLSDDESALLNILRALNDSDREQLVASMSDKPQKKSSKKAAGKVTTREYDHCLRCGTTKRDSSHKDQSSPDYHKFQSSKDSGEVPAKSARASGMAAQLNKQLDGRREPEIPDFGDSGLCGKCGRSVDDNSHHRQTDPNYHEFQSPASSAAGASGD